MSYAVEIQNLTHYYGNKQIYSNLNLNIEYGKIFGILGKNGVGKSTLINIMMGYIKPTSGNCYVLSHPNFNIPNHIKQDIALLFEGFITYDFFTILEFEKFFSSFYSKWKREIFFDLVSLLNVNLNQKLSSLSYGQKSQVVLGALLAQDASLLILDDYSMGLDAGYRRLFIDYLKDYVSHGKKTVIMTSHIMNDLVGLIDEMIIVKKGGIVHKDTISNFMSNFNGFRARADIDISSLNIVGIEKFKDYQMLFSYDDLSSCDIEKIDTNFEDKFLGFVGRYD